VKQRNAPELLEFFAYSKLCMADWRYVFHIHFDELRPLLKKEIGQVSPGYPTEHREIRYTVIARDDRFMGFIRDELVSDWYEDRWFDVEEIQLWSIDPDKVAVYLGPMHAAPETDKPVVKVLDDFHSITLPNGRSVVFGRKYKRRAFLRAVVKYCREHQTDLVPAQTVMADHNASLPGGPDSAKALRTTDVVYELFKGQSDVFKALFEIRDLSAAIFRLKVAFEAV
jgi:hypothetical protein